MRGALVFHMLQVWSNLVLGFWDLCLNQMDSEFQDVSQVASLNNFGTFKIS